MANSATRHSVNSHKTTHHPKRQRRRDRAKERQHPSYETKDWRWGGPRQIPHRPVENRIKHSMKKVAVSMNELATTSEKAVKVFNQFTDIIPGRKTEIVNVSKENFNG